MLKSALHQPTRSRETTMTTPADLTSGAAYREALRRLIIKRLHRFVALVAKVTEGEEAEAVHDARVWSRRLQQALSAFFPKPRPGKVRKLRRMLRRVRRALGEWRNCDVLLGLVEEKWRETPEQHKRMAWELVRESLQQKRSKQVPLARKRLLKHDVENSSMRLLALLDTSISREKEPAEALRQSIERAWSRWQSALAHAQGIRDRASIHAFRIATKRLRYRLELTHELGDLHVQPLVRWLKDLQEILGRWHDREALHRGIAAVLCQPEILIRQSGAARMLLAEIEQGNTEQEARAEEIFRRAADETVRRDLEIWLSSPQVAANRLSL
ncbi:MAG TPA: CHAD domain-containing protein [Candidatus Binatia bacterium]|nr:CHAD domain-containing protein [Candidatus Binatia bacterium]